MMGGLLDGVKAVRESAYSAAAEVLSSLGFTLGEGRLWSGSLCAKDGERHEITVEFPREFPDELPKVQVVFKELQELLPHVDRFGTVCIATDSGVLIDATRPKDVVREVLEKVRDVLSLPAADREKEILREITSYWIDSGEEFYSLCPPDRSSGVAGQVELGFPGKPILVANNCEAATKWAKSCKWGFRKPREAYFLRLPTPILPPAYKQVLTFTQLKELLGEVVPGIEREALEAWIKKAGVPATLLLSVPINEETRRAVLGLRVLPPTGKVLAAAERGFRKDKAPSGLLFARAEDVKTERITVQRLDPEYMLRRGGASTDLGTKRVVVIGCGAVGSHVAQALAQCGVGTLRLIDDEDLACGNVHRHLLGARFVNESKPRGLMARLTEDYPLLKVLPYTRKVQEMLRDSPDEIVKNDVIVCALGDETLERRLNDVLRDDVPRVHTWIEPYGIAGHVLVTGLPAKRGCYGCLFERDERGGLFNAANLTKNGQLVEQTLDGCPGTFTPYGAMDAQIAANHAARAVIRLLQGKQIENSLLSWMGENAAFLDQGLKLSERAQQFREWQMSVNTNFARGDCEYCNV